MPNLNSSILFILIIDSITITNRSLYSNSDYFVRFLTLKLQPFRWFVTPRLRENLAELHFYIEMAAHSIRKSLFKFKLNYFWRCKCPPCPPVDPLLSLIGMPLIVIS